MNPLQQHTLSSGIFLEYPLELDGGGLEQYPEFRRIITEQGHKKNYNHCFEWCAGMAAIGFELLGSGIAHRLTVSDLYLPAVTNTQYTAEINSLTDRFHAYHSSTIADLPDMEPVDLIVANPPHQFDRARYIQGLMDYNNHRDISELTDLDRALRLVCDHDCLIHREFFENIHTRITSDADIFISETALHQELLGIIEQSPLYLLNSYQMGSQLRLLHLRMK